MWIVECVRDRVRHVGRLQRLREIWRIELHPPDGRLRVRKQDADFDVRGFPCLGCRRQSDTDCDNGNDEENSRRPPTSFHPTSPFPGDSGLRRTLVRNRKKFHPDSSRTWPRSCVIRYATASRRPLSPERTIASQTSAERYPSSKVAPCGVSSVY